MPHVTIGRSYHYHLYSVQVNIWQYSSSPLFQGHIPTLIGEGDRYKELFLVSLYIIAAFLLYNLCAILSSHTVVGNVSSFSNIDLFEK